MLSALETSHALPSPALLRRFDTQGPRYTSYPTADRFQDGYGARQHADHLAQLGIQRTPVDLYVHLPFCANICYYCGCNKVVTRDKERVIRYLEKLTQEIRLQRAHFQSRLAVGQMHWGGGTPNYLSLEQMGSLMAVLQDAFAFEDHTECSIELDPRVMDADDVAGIAELGFKRVSIGVQDFDPQVQAAVNRVQSVEMTDLVMRKARAHGVTSINLDLIYGLPRQNERSFDKTLDSLIALAPDRVALYGYAHLPTLFKPQRRIATEDLPTVEQRVALLYLAVERLTEAGYVHIGMDHFARETDSLARAKLAGRLQRNFQGYTTQQGNDLLSFGMSAISMIGAVYAQNAKIIEDYQSLVESGQLPARRGIELNADDLLRRDIIQRFMCNFTLHIPSIERAHGVDFGRYCMHEIGALRQFEEAGLLRQDDMDIVLTPVGRFFVRHICMVFDHYLRTRSTQANYSKAL